MSGVDGESDTRIEQIGPAYSNDPRKHVRRDYRHAKQIVSDRKHAEINCSIRNTNQAETDDLKHDRAPPRQLMQAINPFLNDRKDH